MMLGSLGMPDYIKFTSYLLASVTGLDGKKDPVSSHCRLGGGGQRNGDINPSPSSAGLISTIFLRTSCMFRSVFGPGLGLRLGLPGRGLGPRGIWGVS